MRSMGILIASGFFAFLEAAIALESNQQVEYGSHKSFIIVPPDYEIRAKPFTPARLRKRGYPPALVLDQKNLCWDGAETTWDYLHLKMFSNGQSTTYEEGADEGAPMMSVQVGWGHGVHFSASVSKTRAIKDHGKTNFRFVKPGGVDWWKGIKIHTNTGECHECGGENGGQVTDTWTRAFEVRELVSGNYVEVEIWKAKAFGAHTHVRDLLFHKDCLDGRSVEITFTRD